MFVFLFYFLFDYLIFFFVLFSSARSMKYRFPPNVSTQFLKIQVKRKVCCLCIIYFVHGNDIKPC